MAKNELKNAKQELEKKDIMINVVRTAINDLEWGYSNSLESLETYQADFENYREMYDGDDIESEYKYKDYLATIERFKFQIAAYETVQTALLKLV